MERSTPTARWRSSRRRLLGRMSAGVLAVLAACRRDERSESSAPTTTDAIDVDAPGTTRSPSISVAAATPAPSPTTVTTTAATTAPPPQRFVVACVSDPDARAAVRSAMELSGGLDRIKDGDTVFVKPNAVYNATAFPGVTTSIDVLAAVVSVLKEHAQVRVVVGDRSARQVPNTDTVLRDSGMLDAALAAGADEIHMPLAPAADPASWVLLQPPSYEETWADLGGIQALKRLAESTHVINVPVCKNHRWAGISMSLKNFIGAIGDDSRDRMHYTIGDPARLSRDIALINQMFLPTINVLDARAALVNGGPEGVTEDATRVQPGLIMASTDRVALDAVGAALIKRELNRTVVPLPDQVHAFATTTGVWGFHQIVAAREVGLSGADPNNVELAPHGTVDLAELEDLIRAG